MQRWRIRHVIETCAQSRICWWYSHHDWRCYPVAQFAPEPQLARVDIMPLACLQVDQPTAPSFAKKCSRMPPWPTQNANSMLWCPDNRARAVGLLHEARFITLMPPLIPIRHRWSNHKFPRRAAEPLSSRILPKSHLQSVATTNHRPRKSPTLIYMHTPISPPPGMLPSATKKYAIPLPVQPT